MKKLIPFVILLAVIAGIIIVFQFTRTKPAPTSITNKQSNNLRQNNISVKAKEANTIADDGSFPKEEAQKILSVTEQAKHIIQIADNSDPYSKELLALLNKNEDEVFSYLNSIQYPEEDTDEIFNEILFIAKSVDYYLSELSFNDALVLIDAFSDSPYLYDAAIQQIISNSIGRHEGKESDQYAQIYQWISNNPDQTAAQDAGTAVGGMLFMTDSENAWKKAMELPAGRIRSEAIATIMTQGFAVDIEKTSEVLVNLEMTPDLDPTVSNLVYKGLEYNAQHNTLIDWAVSITDDTLQLQAMNEVIRSWQKNNPSELNLWIENSPYEDNELNTKIKLFYKQAQANYRSNF